jgi:hypothetical protein
MSQTLDPGSALIGAWNLIALRFEVAGSGERLDLFGSAPRGRILVTNGGDFMTVITSADRATMGDTAQLYKTMMAYAGKYRVEDDKLIVSCDLSWHPDWVGTEQVRYFKLEGENLSLRTDKRTHPQHPDKLGYGVIDWQRQR